MYPSSRLYRDVIALQRKKLQAREAKEDKRDMEKKGCIQSAKIISVIEITASKGSGTAGDPYRNVTQYWSLDGEYLEENDRAGSRHKEMYQEDEPDF